MKKIIYVAGPYTAPTREGVQANIDAACTAGMAIILRGHVPLVPHTMTDGFDEWHIRHFGNPRPYESYLEWDFALLKRCDGLLCIGSSPGADLEVKLANELGLTVWYDPMEIPLDTPID